MVKTINIDDEMHRDLKTQASREGTDIKTLSERLFKEYLDGLAEGTRT